MRRCEPGELAIIDRPALNGDCICYLGLPVVTQTVYQGVDGRAYWNVVPQIMTCVHYKHIGAVHRGISDDILRPMRRPRAGSDA